MRVARVTAYRSPLDLVEVPTPEPFGTEVLLEVTACGVCHSDIHYWHGGYELGNGRMLTLEERGVRLPLVMGHEPIGRVVAIGKKAHGVSVGDTRLVFPWIGCGRCPRCRTGRDNDCLSMQTIGLFRPGGYATHVLVPHSKYLVDTAGLEDAYACTLACAGLTAWSALSKVAVRYEDDGVAMIGAGGVGLTAIGFARKLWDVPIVAVDKDAGRLDTARSMGATHVVSAGENAAVAIRDALGGPAAHVIDFVGSPDTAELGLSVLRKGGSLVMIGLHGGSWPLSVPLLPLRNISLIGSLTGTVAETREVVDFVRKHRPIRVPITTVPLSGATQALNNLESGASTGRQVLVPEPI